MQRTALLILCGMLPLLPGMAKPATPFASFSFGLSMATGVGNQVYTCYIVKEFEGRVLSADPITAQEFILQAQGLKPSKANPDGRNFFLDNRINNCLAVNDQAAVEYLYRCDALADLWKLRFQEYPFLQGAGQHPGAGWAETRTGPSARQLLLLSDYGILYLTGLCRGPNVFRLLHDMADTAWVNNYRQGA
jgi:hypothetical protein